MARWKLNTAHYLKVPGVEWELSQISQQTQKTIRKRYVVPQLLDPKEPGDCNHMTPEGGEIIVCWEGLGEPRDIVFFGEPTPDMQPLDAEAERISKSLEHKWQHPIESLQGQGFGDVLAASLQKQLEAAIRAAAQSASAPAQTQSLSGVSMEAFAALQKQVEQLMQQNLELQAKQVGVVVETEEEPLPSEAAIAPPSEPKPTVERRA